MVNHLWMRGRHQEEIKLLPPKLIKSHGCHHSLSWQKSRVLNFLMRNLFSWSRVRRVFSLSLLWSMNSSPSTRISFSFVAFWIQCHSPWRGKCRSRELFPLRTLSQTGDWSSGQAQPSCLCVPSHLWSWLWWPRFLLNLKTDSCSKLAVA